VVHSLLRAAQHDPALRYQLQRQIEITLDGSVAFWRRAAQAQSLWCLGLCTPHLRTPQVGAGFSAV
jgi:hypothetical protein